MELIVLTVWQSDYYPLMDAWKPLVTILHLVDVRAEFSSFERATVLSMTPKTIIIENPTQSSRYGELLAHIHCLSIDKYNELKQVQPKNAIDPATIKEVMSVRRILHEIDRDPSKDVQAIVYGVITKFNIDAALVKACAHCNRFLARNQDECGNRNCALIETDDPRIAIKVYMPISIADHSGTLNGHINDENAQKILGHTAQELKLLPEATIDDIYSRFILNRFEIKVVIKPKSQTEYSANVLSIEEQDPNVIAVAMKP